VAHDSYRLPQALQLPVHQILSFCLQHITFLDTQIKRLDTAIAETLTTIPHTLETIPGIGPVFAGGIVAEVGDVARFAYDQAKVAKFAGFKWHKHQSGDFTAEETRLTGTGNRYLRYYFCEAANAVRMHDREYAAYYERKYREIVFTQMTKGGRFSRRTGWQDIPNLDLAIGDDHTIDEQFDQLPPLGEIQAAQGRLDALAKAADSFSHFGHINLALRLGIQLAQLLAQPVLCLLHLLSFALEFVAANYLGQVGIQQAGLLALELGQRILEGLAARLERLRQPLAHLRPFQFVGDQARLGQHLTQILPDQGVQGACRYVARDTAFACGCP
jgi:hypothetical protein